MKKIKLGFLSFTFALLALTSCTNNEPVVQDQQVTEESQSIVTSLNQLSQQVDPNGNFTSQSNPAGNVVFDFCFDFVYPLTLSYNNGTTVTVESLNDLVNVILNSNQELFVNGIAFPFDVEVYNEDTDAIVIVTIDDEDDFIDLLDDCDFDDFEECACYEVYDPVCVEITDPNGEVFVITYPNDCYAACDGFDEDDFIEDCENDYYPGDLFCFEFNFPLDIVIDGDTIVTVDSLEDLGNAIYDVYDFNFVYPFDVTTEDGIETIEDEDDFEDLLEDCYDDYDDDDPYEECDECDDEEFDPVCIEISTATGTEIVVFPNICYAICEGFTQNDVVEDCDNNGAQDCDENDIVSNLVECEWYAYSSLLSQGSELDMTFNSNGTLTVELEDDTTISGTWEIVSNPSGELFMSFALAEPLDAISNLDWTVVQCGEEFILLESNNEFIALEKDCD
ncbi:hypothetical protein [Winogradskyella sp.]|uniref:hypothetical protein n=1 Tax=Winogradskyella sp. TaxID=1883156 RepID=UPI00262F0E58|nr:hypothetical protein [Winogradskyella sp.]